MKPTAVITEISAAPQGVIVVLDWGLGPVQVVLSGIEALGLLSRVSGALKSSIEMVAPVKEPV